MPQSDQRAAAGSGSAHTILPDIHAGFSSRHKLYAPHPSKKLGSDTIVASNCKKFVMCIVCMGPWKYQCDLHTPHGSLHSVSTTGAWFVGFRV